MPDCSICGAPHASHGLGPPAQPVQAWFCRTCLDFQPHTQKRLAVIAREALQDDEIIIQ